MNVEVGYLAWGIGALVGVAVAFTGSTGSVAGGVAAAITIVSLLVGKFAANEIYIRSQIDLNQQVSEEYVVSTLADDVVAERQAAGAQVDWPAGVSPNQAAEQDDYPADIWQEAVQLWQSFTPEEQAAKQSATQQQYEENMAVYLSNARMEMFKDSFSAFDLIFFGLGVFTAFGIPNQGDQELPDDSLAA